VFRLAEERWGPHNINRFADERNSKCKKWDSRYWTIGGESSKCLHTGLERGQQLVGATTEGYPEGFDVLKGTKHKRNHSCASVERLEWWWPLVMRIATDWMVLGPKRARNFSERGE
jgi:hypothetical protein